MLQNEFHNEHYIKKREIFRTYKEKALSLLPDAPSKVLDIGCGTGVNSEKIRKRGHKVTGTDVSETAIKRYNDSGFDGFIHNVNLPFSTNLKGKFDIVWILDVFEHLEAPQKTLKHISDVLVNKGLLILTVPNSSWYIYRVLHLLGKTSTELQHPYHIRFYNVGLISNMLQGAGFKVTKIIGRNNLLIFPENNAIVILLNILSKFGIKFAKEFSVKHSKNFYHLSFFSSKGVPVFSDNFIVLAEKE
tara:strand:- start:1700 stop:2437 length:738 start_codon:yes stop_codon:yes gene_type:complete